MKSNGWIVFLSSIAGAFLAILVFIFILLIFARPLFQWLIGHVTKRLMSERYPENIWEMVTALTRISPQIVLENSLRASSGKVIERPFGSPRKFLDFDGLIFSPAQLATLPAHEDAPVDVRITIGPKTKKPLTLDIPIMAGGMGYGIGLTESVRLAIAKGTAAAGTATNSGKGGFLQEDRAYAKYYILQYTTAAWNKEPEILKQADAIEIHFGQGASAGTASIIPPEFMQGKARQIMQIPDGETVVIPARHQEIQNPQDLKNLVANLRQITGGIPVGVKICASAKLEADLEVAIQAKVDFISIDGGQAGTKGVPPILEDDFGLPTIYALARAVAYLNTRGLKDQISLLIGGGFTNPGECLKALALGADGIFMGTAVLWAMTHDQVTKAIPFEPPTQLVFYPGTLTEQFDEDTAANCLKNFFNSFTEEMKIAIRALGKTSLKEVNDKDLVALDEWTSRVTKIPLAHKPFKPCNTHEQPDESPDPDQDKDLDNEENSESEGKAKIKVKGKWFY